MKPKSRTPSIIVILLIIVSITPGIGLVKYILNNYSSGVTLNNNSVGYTKTVKSTPSSYLQPTKSLLDYQVIIGSDLFRPLGEQKTVMVASPPKQVIQIEKPQAPPEPLYKLAFTGIVNLGSEYIALVEDSSKNDAYFLRKGDKLKDYVVESITDGSVILSNGNSKITSLVGSVAYYNSKGWLSTYEPRNNQVVALSSSESKAEEPVSVNKNSTGLSLIEQMKARRKKELE
jgi:hypothetical protein